MAQDLALLDQIARGLANVGTTDINDEFSSGIQASFPVLSIKDKEWTLKFQGVEKTHLNSEGEPARAIDVILVKPSKGLTKAWWPETYKAGANVARTPPQCTSIDGDKPDEDSPQKQSVTCAGCRYNVFGSTSLIGGTGKAKACRDAKRVAVFLPTSLLESPPYRAALLRIPPTSLKNLDEYSKVLKGKGVGIDRVITRLRFQSGQQTMIEFEAVAGLPQQTYDTIVIPTRDDPSTARMLSAQVSAISGDYEDDERAQRLAESPLPTGFEAFGVGGAEPGPAQAPQTVRPSEPVVTPAAAPAAAGATVIQLKDGRWFDKVAKKFVEAPAAKKARPDSVVEAEDGTLIDIETGEVWVDEEAPPFEPTRVVPEAPEKAPQSPLEALTTPAATPTPAKAESPPNADAVKAKRAAAKAGAKAAPAAVKEVPAKTNGNGAAAPVVVTNADEELGDALKELFPGGVPGE